MAKDDKKPSDKQKTPPPFDIPLHPDTTFNEDEFATLLAGSLSITVREKQRIVERIPILSQGQIDDLIRIMKEEKEHFAALADKAPSEIDYFLSQQDRSTLGTEVELELIAPQIGEPGQDASSTVPEKDS